MSEPQDQHDHLCDRCHKKKAQVMIRIIDSTGTMREMNLCRSCAAEMQQNPMQVDPQLAKIFEEIMKNAGVDFSKLAGNAILPDLIAGEVEEKSAPRCPTCHHSITEILDTRQLFCRDCWKNFRNDIIEKLFNKRPLTQFIEDSSTRSATGIPYIVEPDLHFQETMDTLNELMEKAVAEERYAEAARFQTLIQDENERICQNMEQKIQSNRGTLTDEQFIEKCNAFHNMEAIVDGNRMPFLPQEIGVDDKPLINLRGYAMLYRNLAGQPLPPYNGCQPDASENVVSKITQLFLQDSILQNVFKEPKVIDPRRCYDQQRTLINSSGLAIREFLSRPHATGIVVSNDRRSILHIGNIDHLQLTLWCTPTEFADTVELSNEIGQRLANHVSFERCEYGHFSRNLLAMGSGYSIGQYLHLPALTFDKQIDSLRNACEQYGLVLAPLYRPDNSGNAPAIYRLKNNISAGIPINRMAQVLTKVVRRLGRCELECREAILGDMEKRSRLSDILGRAAGIVKGAREIDTTEARHLLSLLWFGVELGCITSIERQNILSTYSKIVIPRAARPDDDKALYAKYQINLRQTVAKMFRHDFGHEENCE